MAVVRMIMRMAVIIMVVMIVVVVVVGRTVVMVVIASVVMMTVAVVVCAMIMVMAATDIGAAFRIERRLDLDHAGAKALHHFLDYVVAADPQMLSRDLDREMSVTEMPGEPHHLAGVDAAKFDQRLGGGDHFDKTAIFEHQRIAAAQCDRLRQIEQELEAAGAGHGHATAMTVVELQHDGVGRRLAPAIRGPDRRCAQHAQRLTTLAGVTISITVGDTFIGPDNSRQALRCGA